jgi:TRAP-type C4-dicarboxylate transport system permease small subunit
MSWWLPVLVLAAGIAAAHFGWRVLSRVWRREADGNDYAALDIVTVAFLAGCAVIALAAMGLVYWLLWLVGLA